MRSLCRLTLTLLPLTLASATCCLAQDDQAGFPSAEPTPQHELLKKEVGTWTGEMKFFGPGADLPAMPIRETNTLMDTGLWVVTEFEAGPFLGRGQFGYDPLKKKYVGTWVDNMTPHLMVMEGDYNSETHEMTMFTQGIDQATGKMQDMKAVSRYVDADTRTYTMHAKQAGDWVKMFQVNYQREK